MYICLQPGTVAASCITFHSLIESAVYVTESADELDLNS